MEHTGFPSDETLAAFIDGRLDPEMRGRVIAHMATCSECYSVFMSATEVTANAAVSNGSQRSSRRAWITVAGAAVAAVVAVVLLVTPLRELVLLHRDDPMAALMRAAPTQRTIEGRIAGFPYQPKAPVLRGKPSDPMSNPANGTLLTAAAGVQRLANAHPSVANLHALGVAYLLLGRDDMAIDTLHQALLEGTGQRSVTSAIDESKDVSLLNDLSTALSNRARLNDASHLLDAGEAVRCAERAWRASRSPEAGWNRAIAIEVFTDHTARPAWYDYLAIDHNSPWAAEARKRLAPPG